MTVLFDDLFYILVNVYVNIIIPYMVIPIKIVNDIIFIIK